MFTSILRDVRFAVRSFRATPGFAAIAIAILTIGVATVAVQTAIIRGVLWCALPVRAADEIYAVHWRDPALQPTGPYFGLPMNDLPVWQAAQRTFSATTAFGTGWAAIVQNGTEARRYTGCYVQGNFFSFLGATPLLGRTTDDRDNLRGAAPNVVLSHRLWQSAFGGRTDIVGHTFPLNGKIATVVGVMGPEFRFPMDDDLWIPLYTQYAPREQGNVYSPLVRALGRLAPGVPVRAAHDELQRLAVETARKFPATNGRLTDAVVEPLRSTFVAPVVSRLIWLLFAAVIAVMVLACVNVMNLLLARATLRQHELAVRIALGAPRYALVRKGAAEAAVLAAASLGLGNLVAAALTPWLWAWTQSTEYHLPPWMTFTLDWRVLLVTDAFGAACVLFAATAPGLILARLPVLEALKASSRAVSSRLAGWVASLFIVVQVGLTVVLLVWTSLIVRSIHNQLSAEWGYDLDSVLSARVGLFPSSYATIEARSAVTEKILRELRAAPSITRAAVTDRFRMTLDGSTGLRPETGAVADESTWPQVWLESISEDYFATLGVPLIAGREFTGEEQWHDRPSAIVNRSFVRRFLAGREPLGATIQLQGQPRRTIIGVVPDTLMAGPDNPAADEAGVFVPWTSSVTTAGTLFPTLVVRGNGAPTGLERPLREALARVDPSLAAYYLGTPRALVVEYLAADRIMSWLLGTFTLIALLLAATGIFGLVSMSVSGGLREFAIRIALGAGSFAIIRQVLGRNARELATGLCLGLVLSVLSGLWLAEPLSGVLYRVSPFDPRNYAIVAAVIVLSALLASVAPLWRALQANPVDAMRES